MKAFPTFLLLLLLLIQGFGTFAVDRLREKCSAVVKIWFEQAMNELSDLSEDHQTQVKELLYFLHVPRTGGRSYHQCLLRHLYPKAQHCDRSYDMLRFNLSNHCRLLVTHDDYSILTKLPAESTSVVTNLRHPVDRIFSAYEFSVEVAARFLARTTRMKTQNAKASKDKGPSTLSIWPWSLLVPWMRDDLYARAKRRLSGDAEPLPLGFSNYDASSYVMPLHDFIHQPMARDILHNGATFQVAGLTNNSYIEEAGRIRNCVLDYPDLGLHILNVAKKRLDKMIFVGLTDKHKDSAKLFAHIIGGQILPLGEPIIHVSNNNSSFTNAGRLAPDSDSASQVPDAASVPLLPEENLTVYGLIEKYKNCAGRLRATQVRRRIVSLKNSLPVNFSAEARYEVPEEVLVEIRQMNALDLDLYAYAQQRFESQASSYKYLIHDVSNEFEGDDSKIWDASSHIIGKGFQDSGSRDWMYVLIICVAGVVLMMVARAMVLMYRSRILKLRKWRSWGMVHEKW